MALPKTRSPLLPLGTVPTFPCQSHMLMPAELVDKCVGSQIWIIMNNQKGVCMRNVQERARLMRFQSLWAS